MSDAATPRTDPGMRAGGGDDSVNCPAGARHGGTTVTASPIPFLPYARRSRASVALPEPATAPHLAPDSLCAVDDDGFASTLGCAAGGDLGSGGGAPSRLDTHRESSPNGPEADGSGVGTTPRSGGAYRRHAHGRPVSMGWRPWVRAVATIMERHGIADQASSLRSCGSMVCVRSCEVHGDVSRSVTSSCGSRVCPFCARKQAEQRVALLLGAAERVSGYVAAQAASVDARLTREEQKHAKRAKGYAEKAARAESAGRHAVAARHRVRESESESRRVLAKQQLHAVRTRHLWQWKLITVSPWYDPLDPWSYTPEGIRARVADVLARCNALWNGGLACGGLAGMTVRIEISSKGHVHAHCLYYGRFIVPKWARGVADCFVDVRAVRRDLKGAVDLKGALAEAVKYATKAPSPTRAEWIAGDRFRVLHPELAAAWVVGTRHKKLLKHLGTMGDAVRAQNATTAPKVTEESAEHVCTVPLGDSRLACGRPLSPARLVPTELLARQLGVRWRTSVRIVESKG